MKNIRIENLADYPEYIEEVINWIYNEWGNNNIKYWSSWIRNSINKKGIPQTFIVLVDDELAGTYSLWRCDLQSRQDLFPWFGGLYVNEKYRGKEYNDSKLGVLMQKHAIEQLRRLGFEEVYLFTEKNTKYYNDNGWINIGMTVDENDNKVYLCEYKLK